MIRRRYWGIGLIALAMLMAHLIVLSIDGNRTVAAMTVHALLMFGWSLVINFALRGEIAEIKYCTCIAVVFQIVLAGGILLFGDAGAAVATTVGTFPLSVVLLGASGILWAVALIIASFHKARIDRTRIIDPTEALMGFAYDEPESKPQIVQTAIRASSKAAAFGRSQYRMARSYLRNALFGPPMAPVAAAPLAIPYIPSAREIGIKRLGGTLTMEACVAKAPEIRDEAPVPPKKDPIPLDLEPFMVRTSEADVSPKVAPAPKPKPKPAPKPQARPSTRDKVSTAQQVVREKITAHADEPWNRGMPRPRVRDLTSALSANTTIEAVAVINSTRKCQARLGIRNRGRFVNSSGKKHGFAGLDQLKALVQAEIDSASRA